MEKWNKEQTEIIENIDRAINDLVYEKTQLIKAYNYYHGKRDPEQFRHLEENYGIGTATSVEFVPLVRKHVDVLIGEYLGVPLLPRISCKDKETLSNIHREKQLKIHSEVVTSLKKMLQNTIFSTVYGQEVKDPITERQLLETKASLESNFISDYEIAAQNIVDWIAQSQDIDFKEKRKTLLTDLLISGTCYYKTLKSSSETSMKLQVLNPLNTFIDRNPTSPYLKKSMRAVHREYMTKDQILAKYGHLILKEDLDVLDTLEDFSIDGSSTTYLRSYDSVVGNTISDGILGGFEVTPLLPYERNTNKYFKMYPVYEVEWLKTEKEGKEYIVNRYEGVRIGGQIYIPLGKSEEVFRSITEPNECSLSINGIFYADRNGDPISLMLATANLQDKFDVLCFYRDNVIAESGTVGDWVDVAYLPKFLGSDLTERLMKWKAYKKQGLALIDSSQEGLPPMNTTFGGFDDTIKMQTIQAIDIAIQRVEETCSTITGVFREKLGGIEQRDAVTNVQVGVRQSSFITKQYYHTMDLMTREMLIDLLNLAKVVYKNGINGTLILGDKLNKTFTALPEYYTFTDHDVHIADTQDVLKEQETMKQLTFEFIKGGIVDPEVILEVVTATGLTKMKHDVLNAMRVKKEETNQLGQLSQQVEQLNQQLQQTTQEAQKLQQQVQSLNAEKLKLEKEKLEHIKAVEWFKARTDSSYKEEMLEWEKKRIQFEALQLLDNNKQNDEIRNT